MWWVLVPVKNVMGGRYLQRNSFAPAAAVVASGLAAVVALGLAAVVALLEVAVVTRVALVLAWSCACPSGSYDPNPNI